MILRMGPGSTAMGDAPSDTSPASNCAAAIVQTVHEPLLVLDDQLRVKQASRSYFRTFKVSQQETEGRLLYELGNGQWNIPALRKLLEEMLPAAGEVDDYQVDHDFPN